MHQIHCVRERERRQADVQSLGPGQSDHRVLLIRICGLDGIQRDRSQARGQVRGTLDLFGPEEGENETL